jgi:aspartate aminotransferase
MPIAQKMIKMVEGMEMVKKMFEEGARLKAEHGAENVFDFSIGNPDVPPPPAFKKVLKDLVNDESLYHGYMPNPGYPHVRQAVAEYLNSQHDVNLTPEFIVMTVGAAGALNDTLNAVINPGEEILTPSPYFIILTPSPYFIGYDHYAFVAGAAIKTAPTAADFHLDVAAIASAITAKTRVMLINSPNNPTGAVYSEEELAELGRVLDAASQKFGKRIYLVADEPYRKIVYDVTVPSIFQAYPHSIIVSSYSKELSLAGERIGYLAVNPVAEDAGLVASAAAVFNTMLCVNAPSLPQLAVSRLQGITVDVSIYRILKEELILTVPGAGFAGPGYFRLSYAVPDSTISGSMAGFKRAFEKV